MEPIDSTKLGFQSVGDLECNANLEQKWSFGIGVENSTYLPSTVGTSNPKGPRGNVRNIDLIARKLVRSPI